MYHLIKISIVVGRSYSVHVCCVTWVMPDYLQPCRLWPTRLLCPWDSPSKNTGLGCPLLLQESSQPGDGTHVSCLLHWRWVLYLWHLLGSPEIHFYLNIKNILKEIKTVLAYFSITSNDFLSLITTITSMTTFPNGGRKKKQ